MLTLAYSASINRADAVAHAYELGTIDTYQDVALLLRQAIYNAFKESEPLPWPPTAEDLDVNLLNEVLPSDLETFLNYVVSGDERNCVFNWSGNHMFSCIRESYMLTLFFSLH